MSSSSSSWYLLKTLCSIDRIINYMNSLCILSFTLILGWKNEMFGDWKEVVSYSLFPKTYFKSHLQDDHLLDNDILYFQQTLYCCRC